MLAGEAGSATPEYMAQLRQRFGLDQPLLVQLVLYVKSMVALDLGFSGDPLHDSRCATWVGEPDINPATLLPNE